jgi:hypothetical protein
MSPSLYYTSFILYTKLLKYSVYKSLNKERKHKKRERLFISWCRVVAVKRDEEGNSV